MKIGAYFHMSRIGLPDGNGGFRIEPTGVGKHILDMLHGLSALPNIELTGLIPYTDLDSSKKIPPQFPITYLPVVPLPYSRRYIETTWTLFNSPKIDRWYPNADWIYCPQEACVATRHARLAVTAHDTYPLEAEHRWSSWREKARTRFRWKLLYRAIKRHAGLILAVSEFTKSRLVNLLDFDPKTIAVIGNAVDDFYFAPAPPESSATTPLPDNPYLLIVGGLAQKKGGDFLLAVAPKLLEKRPDLKIVVCGVTDPAYKERAAQLNNIIRFGYVPIEQHLRLLKGARALLMLSRYEGFGIPAVEAMAAGTPAIVSRFASLPEVVGDGGISVDAQNTDEVVNAIEKIDQDTSFRQIMIAKGSQRAQNFRREAIVARLVAALNRA